MKYFKVTNKDTEDSYYTSFVLPNETPTHIYMSEHLDPRFTYNIEEVTAREYHSQLREYDLDVDEEDIDDDEYFYD